MAKRQRGKRFPATYRAREMGRVAGWIRAGESGSVIGLAGCGRSNFLDFLCDRPEVLQPYLPDEATLPAVLLIDFKNLPAEDPTTLYLVILRAFYWRREQFSPPLREAITELYLENRATQNPFLAQSALYELIFTFEEEGVPVVLVLNNLDIFAQSAPPQTLRTLRGLRDNFKETLSFMAGMMQETRYLSGMGELLGRHVCWIGPMVETDARDVLGRATRTAPNPPSDSELTIMIDLSGGFPALLRAGGYWWLEQEEKPPTKVWFERLFRHEPIVYWLERLWQSFSEEEKFVLAAVWTAQQTIKRAKDKAKAIKRTVKKLERDHGSVLEQLVRKGVCYKQEKYWHLMGQLFTAYVAELAPDTRGRIGWDPVTKRALQGQQPLELPPKPLLLLHYLIHHPGECLDYERLLYAIWPEDVVTTPEGGTYIERGPDDLFALVRTIRQAIGENGSDPHYIINRTVPVLEDGVEKAQPCYTFYPEGKPR